MDDALRSFEGVLVEKPTNLVALLGKVMKFLLIHSPKADAEVGTDPLCKEKLSRSSEIVSRRSQVQSPVYT